MTLIQRPSEAKVDKMDDSKMDNGKSVRPVRNRRYTRRCLVAGQRPQKRLFTPEIKRYLKDWLVRRRENPYPNREEKKHLSRETGLTYIQICNWFANWRRKLKNVNADRNQLTWGHLIRTYNDRAQGNVEQFSICSDDSIWSEPELTSPETEPLDPDERFEQSPDSAIIYKQDDTDGSSTSQDKYENFNNNSNEIEPCEKANCNSNTITSPVLLSKWLESAARFQPSEANYSWWAEGRRRKQETKIQRTGLNAIRHDRDEVEAAVALTTLATATSRLTAP
ncbi:iroquois-class homeodomain protein IRX-2 [Maniola jurtina]|uniref:iroquois-class homeodomain protein IRX-2 n=1 Tax=Maniola jurtina TaxID=191418 RepID=UPI001E68F2C0|nr:iroquois-class homeodomain protein IRX-2 [Maniola jurtina]